MNLYSITREAFRRFITRHQVSQVIHGRTYVFVFVPLDFRETDQTAKAQGAHPLIGGSRSPGHNVDERDRSGEEQHNWDLMWTRFLPNPLWPPNERK